MKDGKNEKPAVFCINFDFSVKKNWRRKKLSLAPTNEYASMSCLTTKLVYLQYPLSTHLDEKSYTISATM